MTETVAPDSSQMAPSPSSLADDLPLSAGERFGWLFSSLWLIFLAFPYSAFLAGDEPGSAKAIGVALLIAFCALYARANYRLSFIGDETGEWAWWYFAALIGIALASVSVLGADALAFAPYVSSWAIFALPRRWALAITVACIALSLLAAFALEARFAFYTFIIASVSIANGGVALFMHSGRHTQELRLRTTLAADQERVARDVHDVLGHSLTAVVVKSELAQRLVLTDPERARRELAEIESLSRTALAEIRATVDGLRATRLSDEIETARHLLAAAGIELDVPDHGDQDEEVDPRASVVLAWAVREATTNIVRHSGARVASIRWGRDWVEISDDGRGIDSANDNDRRGSGLAGLRERVIAMGGTISVENLPDGSGTRVRVDAFGGTR